MKRLLAILTLTLLAGCLRGYEIEPVEGEVGSVWIIQNLNPTLPDILFAVDRGTFEEITAVTTEYSLLQDDYKDLKESCRRIQEANSTLWNANRDLERKAASRARIIWTETVAVATLVAAVITWAVLK